MMVVLYTGGHRYPLGPDTGWDTWLDDLARKQLTGYTLERYLLRADARHIDSCHIAYTLAREPWPAELTPEEFEAQYDYAD